MQYNRARWYDAPVGRFTTIDPDRGQQRRPITLNKYLYAGDDPVNRFDPSGMEDLPSVTTTMAVVNVNRGISMPSFALYTVQAIAIACASEAAITTVMGYAGASLTSMEGCGPNQMRLQIQGSRSGTTLYTEGYTMQNVVPDLLP